MSSTKTLNFSGGYIFVASLDASFNTVRRSNSIFDPGKRAVIVRTGSATLLHTALASGARSTQKHPQDLPWEAEVRRPSPNHRETDPPECLRPVWHQGHCSQISPRSSSPARYFNLSISSRISHTVCLVPPFRPSVASQSTGYFCCHFRHFWCPHSFQPTYQSWHKRNRPLTLTFFGIKKNIVVQACCGHVPLCSAFSKNSTISPLVSLVKSKRTFGWKSSHPTRVFALYNLDTFQITLF